VKKHLYKVTLNGLGSHYVVATDPSSAYQLIRDEYDRTDYGFVKQRWVKSIEVIASADPYPENDVRLWIQEKI